MIITVFLCILLGLVISALIFMLLLIVIGLSVAMYFAISE